jgi:glycosyltransferase involved in cell wall biosynthesis
MRVLFVTNDRLGRQRAGPAIRCVELAKVLSRDHEVTVASGLPGDAEVPGVQLIFDTLANPSRLRQAARRSDVVVTQGLVLDFFPFLQRSSHLVIDLYDPYLFEHLAPAGRRFANWRYLRQWHLLNEQLRQGDFFICANERQWDYWLGRLCALGRLIPEEYNRDPSFRKLLAVVPFGIQLTPPQHTRQVIKGVIPGISEDDTLLLWAGGIWQWFDPLTLIRAMSLIPEDQKVKLLFLGTRHPNPEVPEMPILNECRKLAQELGVLGRSVFFREGWVPFDERQNFLLEADIGVSAHTNTVETRLAFRTRILDYIWAGLPMILSEGDYFADFVIREKVGRTIPPGDAEGWKREIISLAGNHSLRQEIRLRLEPLRQQFHWDRVAEPLVRYCQHPQRVKAPSALQMCIARFLSPAYRQLLNLKRRSGWAS